MNTLSIFKLYYLLKPLIPRKIQILMRRSVIRRKLRSCAAVWPVDVASARLPENWCGWPGGKRFALISTHDVETVTGLKKCQRLMNIEMDMGFRSSFNFVPGDYHVNQELRQTMTDNNFEVGVHGWTHDGSLYKSRKIFQYQAIRINEYLKKWGAVGFRSPSMHHNLEWLLDLDIEYDLSTFDTDPFEPQSDGMGTIFPFMVESKNGRNAYVEIPYTLPQDFTLFILMKEQSIDIWKRKLDWIAEKGGMALVNTHPDYMNFTGTRLSCEEYPSRHYEDLLDFVRSRYEGEYWHVLPRDMAHFWAGDYCKYSGRYEHAHLNKKESDALEELA